MSGATQQCVQPRHQFAQIEGLGQIVVGAGLQPRDAVIDRIPGRQNTNRDVVSQCSQRGDDGDTVEFRHLDIQNQRVVRFVR